MATATVSDTPSAPAADRTPGTLAQVGVLAGYQLRDYLRSRRFIILYSIVAGIGLLLTVVVGYYRPAGLLSEPAAFYGSAWAGGATFLVVLSAVFFGGDAIAGEFQNKTGYFLMGLPIRRAAVYSGKFIASFVAALGAIVLYLLILIGNGAYYFGANFFPWQLAASFGLTFGYLLAVLGTTFLFSSLFKTSAYGILLTAVLFLFGFTIIEDVVVGLWNIEPWFIISYAQSAIGNIFITPYPVTSTIPTPGGGSMTNYVASVPQAVAIMLGYFVLTTLGGLGLFEREEFA